MLKRLLLGLLGLALLLAWIGWLGAIRDPVVVRYRVALPGLARPLRIAHLSDIHGSAWDMPEPRIARIVAQVNGLHPDLVVMTGDFHASKLLNPPMRMEAALRPLVALKAPLGVWSVPGNHDNPYWIRRVMATMGLHLLAGRIVDVGPVQLLGSDDLVLGSDPVAGVQRAAAAARPDKPIIALVHEPTLFGALPANVGLLLAGHTHGGQIRLFGWPRLRPEYEPVRRGLYRNAAGQQLLVSSGIGTSIIPARIGVTPEIVLIDLVPAPQPPGRNSGTDR